LNLKLRQVECSQDGRAQGLAGSDVLDVGQKQARQVIAGFQGPQNEIAAAWARKRFESMTSKESTPGGTLCSLVDEFEDGEPKSSGHVVVIPGFGRFIFGELLLTPDSAQLVSIRAELGCPVKGQITINCVGGGGVGNF
jgi:hypothetical protein